MGLQQFEQRLERLVEGVFAKAFRSGLQPIELGRRMVREMDLGRTIGVRGVIAPNHFTITVGPDDAGRLAPLEHTLLRDLTDYVREHARTEGYRFAGPVTVELATDPALLRGAFRVDARHREGGPTAALVLADGTRIGVEDEPLIIGRAGDSDVVVSDPTVSKRHVEVRREGEHVTIVDLGSTNGTQVNGVGIKQRALADGDEIRIGATVLRYEAL
jgi:hypothetical protein